MHPASLCPSLPCLSAGIVAKSGACCPAGASLDAAGECCPAAVDVCGVCGGTGTTVDASGACCPGPLDATGACCASGAIDECGVCDGDGTSCLIAFSLSIAGLGNASAGSQLLYTAQRSVAVLLGIPQLALRAASLNKTSGPGTATLAMSLLPPSPSHTLSSVLAKLQGASAGGLAIAAVADPRHDPVCGNGICEVGGAWAGPWGWQPACFYRGGAGQQSWGPEASCSAALFLVPPHQPEQDPLPAACLPCRSGSDWPSCQACPRPPPASPTARCRGSSAPPPKAPQPSAPGAAPA